MIYRNYLKRPMDFTLSLIAIILLCPVLLIVGVLVRVKLGSPIIFKQRRPGFNEKIFTMYKFRTMTDQKDEKGEYLPDSVRLTPFGKWLRSTSLDELPELFNILKGDMSIVGPRPQLVRDMVFMTPEQRKRHDIQPGLSGWAQINGRNSIDWEEKLNFDLEYLNRISFCFDLRIILITLKKVYKSENIEYEGMATAEDLGEYLLRTGSLDKKEYEAKQMEFYEINKNVKTKE